MALRLMAVHAHPDDESSKGAATMARYAAEGVEVLVVTCTGGERGDVLNPHHPPVPGGIAGMRAVREAEMARAAAALGVRQRWLGFVDSGLPEGDPRPPVPAGSFSTLDVATAAAPLVAEIRAFRPHVLTTYDPTGGYPHPDHVMTHTVSMAAVDAAADPGYHPGEDGVGAGGPGAAEPWQVAKVYYVHGFSMARMRALHEAMAAAGLASPFGEWIESRMAREIPEREVTTRVPCGDFFAARDAALLAHATQIDPEGFFFAVPRDIERAAWPVEEFELAWSQVAASLPEDDLFAGLRGDVG